MNYQAILLDFYGTCVAEDDNVIHRIISAIRSHTPTSYDEILKSWRFNEACQSAFGASFRLQKEIEISTLQKVLDTFNVHLNVEELSQDLFQYWARPTFFPDTLDFLRQQKVPVIVVSNIDTDFLKSAISDFAFDFPGIVTSEMVRGYKPRPQIFEAALRVSGCQPDEVVHIGDSYSLDVMGAHNCGIDVVWVNRKGKKKPDGLMTFEVSTLSEIRWNRAEQGMG